MCTALRVSRIISPIRETWHSSVSNDHHVSTKYAVTCLVANADYVNEICELTCRTTYATKEELEATLSLELQRRERPEIEGGTEGITLRTVWRRASEL